MSVRTGKPINDPASGKPNEWPWDWPISDYLVSDYLAGEPAVPIDQVSAVQIPEPIGSTISQCAQCGSDSVATIPEPIGSTISPWL